MEWAAGMRGGGRENAEPRQRSRAAVGEAVGGSAIPQTRSRTVRGPAQPNQCQPVRLRVMRGAGRTRRTPVEPSSHLRTRWERENALTVEIDQQSDAGAINLD